MNDRTAGDVLTDAKVLPRQAQGSQQTDLALHTIGWKSFQDLCAHVCEEELQCTISIYREANDGGQDATFLLSSAKVGTSTGTVQCKYASDPRRRMQVSDLTPEVEKVKTLVQQGQAETYIFITNMSLDAPVAKDMRIVLEGLGVKNAQIWGKEKIVQTIRVSARLRALVPQVYGLGDLSVIIDERAVEQTRAMLGHWLPKLKSYYATASHNGAVRALEKHGAVLLLGNPSTGKSTIGAILSTIASDDFSHTVLQITSPKDFETHWNTHDKKRFFWIDDAFGPNVLREEFVQDWSSLFSKVRVAIQNGNRFLFTSRRHIYTAAAQRLGNRNLEFFGDRSAIVEVGRLSDDEKLQILYNHIKYGNQSRAWKQKAKPHLEAVAKTEGFLPGIAERLGNSTFTKNLVLSKDALVRFMAEPEEHLIETIKELEPPMRAALILVFANQGYFRISSPNLEVVEAVEKATDVRLAQIADALGTLENSFLRRERSSDGEIAWEFEHPTISDALTKILEKQPQMLAALLRGAKVSKVLSDFVCHGVDKVRDAVTVPQELTDILVDRLASTPDEPFLNRSLFSFLLDRANNDVFRRVIKNDYGVLDRTIWYSGEARLNPKFRVHARASSLSLLPEATREETASLLMDAALSDFDLTFVDHDELLRLISPRDLFALGAKVRITIEDKLDDMISNISTDADLDGDAESNFETIREGLQVFEEVVGLNADEDSILSDAHSAVEREIETIQEQQEERRREREAEESADWTYAQSNSRVLNVRQTVETREFGPRSIFDDVDV